MATGIREWLESLGLVRYATTFEENDLDLDLLADLTETTLNDHSPDGIIF